MCFAVAKGAKAPRVGIVYKVVRRTIAGQFRSVPRGALYTAGEVFESDVGTGRYKTKTQQGDANAGMYVYLCKDGASLAKSSHDIDQVVIAIRVSPKAFLCLQRISDCGGHPAYRKATYRRGRVLGVVG